LLKLNTVRLLFILHCGQSGHESAFPRADIDGKECCENGVYVSMPMGFGQQGTFLKLKFMG